MNGRKVWELAVIVQTLVIDFSDYEGFDGEARFGSSLRNKGKLLDFGL